MCTEREWTIMLGSNSHDKNIKNVNAMFCCFWDFLTFCCYTDLTFEWAVLFPAQTMLLCIEKKGLWLHLNHSWHCLVVSRLRCCFYAVWPAPTNLLFHQQWQSYYAYLQLVEDMLAQQSHCMLWQPVASLAAEICFLYSCFSLFFFSFVALLFFF